MRQLTYQQAATCNENLKARVTPEQSDKIQQAWFAAGKTWSNGGNLISKNFLEFLYLREDGLRHANCSCEENFISDNAEEIELIDDIEQPDFASQQEILRYLDAKDGNKVIHSASAVIVGFKDGKLWDFKNNQVFNCDFFEIAKNWQKHTPPRLIRVNSIEVPAPLESLDKIKVVFIPSFFNSYFQKFNKKDMSEMLLKEIIGLGIGYATKEDAIARAEAMMKFEVVE